MPQGIATERSAPGARSFVALDGALRSRGINVHYTTWLRVIRRKGLPAVKVGGRYYIDLEDLDRWICDQSAVPQPAPTTCVASKAMRPRAAEAVLAARRKGGKGTRRRANGGRS